MSFESEKRALLQEWCASIDRLTGYKLSEDELLLNAFERAAIAVSLGAPSDSDDFRVYGYAHHEIIKRMKP